VCDFLETREIIPCFNKENIKILVAVMRAYKTLVTILFMVITLFGFSPLSIAQEVGKEELFDDHYDGLDYDEEKVGYSATIYFYSPGLSATVNDNPQLSNGKVAPESGDSSTQFYYSVDYSDTNEDVPATISVFVDDIPSTLTLDSGVAYNGTYKSAAKTLGSGNHTYYFNATDGDGGSARLPESGSVSGPRVNDAPELSNGKVEPSTGTSSTQFFYEVFYHDPDKDSPPGVYVYIDGTPSTMTLDSGVVYNGTYKSAAMTLDSGVHAYYFMVTDGSGGSARLPVSESYSGPTVNNLPRLSSGEVIPHSGGDSTDFYYYVDYYDEDEDVPETAYVYIDNVAYVMSLYSGKGYNGVYRYGPKLFKSGDHEFYFSFVDGYDDIVKLPSGESYSGPEMLSGEIYVYDNIGDAHIILDDSDSGYTTPATLAPVNRGIHKVSLLKDNYVSFPSYATVEVAQEAVEVPFILLSCPAAVALKNESDSLHLLRDFRDGVLNQTGRGKEYIDLYYTNASEISLIMMNNSEVKNRMETLLHQLVPLVTPLMERENVILTSEMKDEIELLLDALEAKSSPFLKAALKRVRKELNKGEIFKDMGFEVEEGSFKMGE
jgi:hypothetical protein